MKDLAKENLNLKTLNDKMLLMLETIKK